jgi:1-acyl-sn-glycerol-3-phosphate acyltransferase
MKRTKQAIEEGFDVLVLPEGQLNPKPLDGVQPVFPGAWALAKMSKRPIQMVALHGCHNMWHADDDIGMTVVDKDVTIKAYPPLKNCETYEDFLQAFTTIVGNFGATGRDIPDQELSKWLDL